MPTHLSIMIEAYDQIGLIYHLFRQNPDRDFLATMNKDQKAFAETCNSHSEFEYWSGNSKCMEFSKEGQLLYY